MHPLQSKAFRLALMIGSVVPVLVFVVPLYVEMPFADQWMLVDLFEKVGAGEAGVNDFTAWHDQHRLVFPRFILTPLAFATGWSMKAEIFLGILFAGATAVVVARLARQQAGDQAPGVVFAGNLACALVIFSLGQLWNWRWSLAFALFMVNLCVCIAVLFLASGGSRPSLRRLAGAAALCFVASFSVAHGLLSWLALLPLVVAFGTRASRVGWVIALWLGTALLSWGLFFWGGIPSDRLSSVPNAIWTDPLPLASYFFTLLGAPWAYGLALLANAAGEVLALPGIAALVLFGVLAFSALFRNGADHRQQALPWICLGLFGLLYAGANMLGRGRLAVLERPLTNMLVVLFPSMYSTPTSLLTVGVLQLGALAVRQKLTEAGRVSVSASKLLALGMASILAANLAVSTFIAFRKHDTFLPPPLGPAATDRACLELWRYLTHFGVCVRGFANYGGRDPVERLEALDRLGFRPARTGIVFEEEPSGDVGRLNAARELTAGATGTVMAYSFRGVVSPTAGVRPGAAVLLSRLGERRFFGLGALPRRTDVPGAPLEWSIVVPIRDVPAGKSVVSAWLFDPGAKRFLKLDGEIEVLRPEV